ncbi:hypothetical protein OEZ85_013452 [Tetradesmus obliquus]|uniref:Uncharacterized protein n=1 Tax=Tetradesmus obliquus TaxID=3088 RepID=A0ABY8UTS9_TETOB|nr:hypothetical protein OEZ85_013452 [Tetradesmus obliquus]
MQVQDTIAGWHKGLGGLSDLKQLQHLQVKRLTVRNVRAEQHEQHVSAGLARALPELSRLTHLSIDGTRVVDSALQGLSNLQQLRELRLQWCVRGPELVDLMRGTFAQLPGSLCILDVYDSDMRADWWRAPSVVLHSSSAAAGRLRQLSSLQQLELRGVVWQDAPGLLCGLSQLTSLNLGDRWFGEGVPVSCPPWGVLQQLRELRMDVNRLDMLQVLPLGLTLLELRWLGRELLSSSTAPSVAQLSGSLHLEMAEGSLGLVCPSILQKMPHLRYLFMVNIAGAGLPVLLAAVQNMQQLQHLTLGSSGCQALAGDAMQQYAALTALWLGYDEESYRHDYTDYPQPIGPGDLARLAAACPALQQLWAVQSIQPGADLQNLALLTSLTHLKVGRCGLPAEALAAALAPMSQLQDLLVHQVGFGAAQLAALTQLTRLQDSRCQNFGRQGAAWRQGFSVAAQQGLPSQPANLMSRAVKRITGRVMRHPRLYRGAALTEVLLGILLILILQLL